MSFKFICYLSSITEKQNVLRKESSALMDMNNVFIERLIIDSEKLFLCFQHNLIICIWLDS